jgi:NlpC/P60 family
MRSFLFIFVITGASIIAGPSCNSSHKISNRVNATVIPDTARPVVRRILTDSIKHYDSIQIEFANKLFVPYDSIYNLNLYRFIKTNLGKKCGDTEKITNNNCGIFLEKQVTFKNFEFYRDTSYLKEGDILFFSIAAKQKDKITHAGFYLHNGYFVVATNSAGIIITGLSKTYWGKRFIAAGRINKLKEESN